MSVERVRKYFKEIGESERIVEFETSTSTSESAAKVLGCKLGCVAKTISVFVNKKPILVLLSGDTRIDNKKFKIQFGCRPRLIPSPEVEKLIGHPVGGVCPFAINEGVSVYLDVSLKRFEEIYPAAGNDKSLIKFKTYELEHYVKDAKWIDVTKINL